jgi:hypothetical protein
MHTIYLELDNRIDIAENQICYLDTNLKSSLWEKKSYFLKKEQGLCIVNAEKQIWFKNTVISKEETRIV